jgi:hypothetical protein
MGASPKVGDLGFAIDLITQPLLIDALVAIDEGKALEDALPTETDAVALAVAVHRLAAIGAVRLSADGLSGRHVLTPRGGRLLGLLTDLDTLVGPEPAASYNQ